MKCPATMCPLIAPGGSPWSGEVDAECVEDACPWWSMACKGGGMDQQVLQVERGEAVRVIGPNQPRREPGVVKTYDCPRAHECCWQKQAGDGLCPPRLALSKGIDPRVCLF